MYITITGHRPNKLGGDYKGTSPKVQSIKMHLNHVLDHFGTDIKHGKVGMALGIDQIFCRLLLARNIPVWAYIPFKGQELNWPKQSQDDYHVLLQRADRIIIVDTGVVCISYEAYEAEPITAYNAAKMQLRNQAMVDDMERGIDQLVGIWDGSSGGTANCIKYAQGKLSKMDITIIDPNHLPDL